MRLKMGGRLQLPLGTARGEAWTLLLLQLLISMGISHLKSL
jgi:hypothetical protein